MLELIDDSVVVFERYFGKKKNPTENVGLKLIQFDLRAFCQVGGSNKTPSGILMFLFHQKAHIPLKQANNF